MLENVTLKEIAQTNDNTSVQIQADIFSSINDEITNRRRIDDYSEIGYIEIKGRLNGIDVIVIRHTDTLSRGWTVKIYRAGSDHYKSDYKILR